MISSNIQTTEQITWKIQNIQAQIEWSAKGGLTSEVARLEDSLTYQRNALAALNAQYAPEAIAERDAKYAATIAQIEAAIKAYPAQAATLRKTLKALKK